MTALQKRQLVTILDKVSDCRIHLVRHETNRGIAAARNTAASHSKGEFLLPLDADDLLAPNYIERTMAALAETGASVAYTDVKIFGTVEKIHTPSTDLPEIFAGHFPHNTLLMKREVFDAAGGYDTECLIEDTEFWISAIAKGTKFAHVCEPLYHYRKHPNSFSATHAMDMLRDFFVVMSKHHTAVAKDLPHILENWVQMEQRRIEQKAARDKLVLEHEHMEKEYALLKERFDSLESTVARNEKILDSIPQLTRQLLFLALKRKTGTQSHA